MANDSQYRVLLSKYNVAVARIRDLEEQNRTNSQHWKTEVASLKLDLDVARDFCIDVLCKDRREMVLGKARDWSTESTRELISRAAKFFVEYNKQVMGVLEGIQTECERRGDRINGLSRQIAEYRQGDTSAFESSIEDDTTDTKKQKKDAEYRSVSKNANEAAATGKIEMIVEGDNDSPDTVDVDIQECINAQVQSKLTHNAIPIANSKKKMKQFGKAKEKAEDSHLIDLNELEDSFNDEMWKLIEVIGKKGLSRYADIKELLQQDPGYNKNRYTKSAETLVKMNVLTLDSFALPLSPRVYVYTLAEIGVRIFRKKYGVSPVVSEAAKIIKEHDNLEHGYAIADLGKLLMASGYYEDVRTFNRNAPKKLENGMNYVADLVCRPLHKRYIEYIEYERGTHSLTEFKVKCNKMSLVSRHLHFVAPNQKVLLNKIKPHIDEWIKSRKIESISNIIIRISTVKEFENCEDIPGAWIMVYDLSKSHEPIVDFSKKETDIT